jgi:hypothetical protein
VDRHLSPSIASVPTAHIFMGDRIIVFWSERSQ